jgi:excisionase family DNA binding protein
MNQTVGDLVPVSEAAQRLGVSRVTLRRRIAQWGVPCYRSALDTRLRLIREADIERLFKPVLEEGAKKRSRS